MSIQITLDKIASKNPCPCGWRDVLKSRGYEYVPHGDFKGDDTEFPLSEIIDSNCLGDAIWCFRCLPEYDNLWRKYAVWCAAQVSHLMKDERSKKALIISWKYLEGLVSKCELINARGHAHAAAYHATYHAASHAAAAAAEVASAASFSYLSVASAAYDASKEKQKAKLKEILAAGKWVGENPVEHLMEIAE